MYELFERVFGEVMKEVGASGWWEVYDSETFEIVRERIAAEMGITIDELDEQEDFREWDHEMAMDL